jgi:hypothetical protein
MIVDEYGSLYNVTKELKRDICRLKLESVTYKIQIRNASTNSTLRRLVQEL